MGNLGDFLKKIETGELDDEITKIITEWNEKNEKNRWKDEPRFNNYLELLVNLLNKKKSIHSDDFIYNDEEINSVCSGEEFSVLTNSFFDFIEDYANENKLNDKTDFLDDYFVQSSYCVKIKGEYYRMQLIVGQGSFVSIEKIEEFNDESSNNENIIEYDKIYACMKTKKNLDLLKKELKRINEFRYKEENEELDTEGISLIEAIVNKQIPEDISLKFLHSFNSVIYRDCAIRYMGFALITKKFVRCLAKYIGNNKCLEIMSGQGCLAKSLKDEGVDIIATDNYSWNGRLDMSNTWTDIENIDCLDAIEKYGKDVSYVLCSWIPYNSNKGYEALKLLSEVNPECKMIVIGEGYGGCTADDLFFEHLEELPIDEELEKNFRSWNGIYDYISVVQFKK